jgi:hypothetical protein
MTPLGYSFIALLGAGAASASYYAPGDPLANVVVGFLIGAIVGPAVLVWWSTTAEQSRGQIKRSRTRDVRIVTDADWDDGMQGDLGGWGVEFDERFIQIDRRFPGDS